MIIAFLLFLCPSYSYISARSGSDIHIVVNLMERKTSGENLNKYSRRQMFLIYYNMVKSYFSIGVAIYCYIGKRERLRRRQCSCELARQCSCELARQTAVQL